jgi:hypothetical protein
MSMIFVLDIHDGDKRQHLHIDKFSEVFFRMRSSAFGVILESYE